MTTETKPNILDILGSCVTLVTPKGSRSGYKWDGARLTHPNGESHQFTAEVTAEIKAAVAAYTPSRRTAGYADSAAEAAAGRKPTFEGVEGDANGVYYTQSSAPVKVAFAKTDMIK